MNFAGFSDSRLVEAGVTELATAAKQMLESGKPLQDVYFYIFNLPASGYEAMRAKQVVGNKLGDIFVERNNRGVELEGLEAIDAAIALYEENVTDCFVGTHPYERLRIIYTRQRRYMDAIRVCNSYLSMLERYRKKNGIPKIYNHIRKLHDKAEKALGAEKKTAKRLTG